MKLLLFAIALLQFDVVLAMESTGMGAVVFVVGVIGLVVAVFGLARRDSPLAGR